ncbi:MAG: hypothetical protein KDE32_00910 [Novosphingobium sp.]|nr:hypothetical protein [Novosphingobium sp.]
MSEPLRVLILDEIEVLPGMANAVREAYRQEYAPAATARGMKLEAAWQNPPAIDIVELPATLFWLWSVEGEAGWWKQRLSRKADGTDEREDKLAFWQGIAPLISGRRRRMLTDQQGDA